MYTREVHVASLTCCRGLLWAAASVISPSQDVCASTRQLPTHDCCRKRSLVGWMEGAKQK